MNPAAVFDMIRWNAVCLLSLLVLFSFSSMGSSYHEFERLFKSGADRLLLGHDRVDREIEAPGGKVLVQDLEPEDQRRR